MNRPTFITMSTLIFTIVAYFAVAQAAESGDAFTLDPRGLAPKAVGTGFGPLQLSSIDKTGAPSRR